MGRLCSLNLFCTPDDISIAGYADLTDGSPLSAMDLWDHFPYVTLPTPGSTGIPICDDC